MAFSKELRAPKEWSKYHRDIANEAVDPELYNEEECLQWLVDLGLCDKATAKKYADSLRPYHFMRCMIVEKPTDPMCKEIFKLWTNITVSIFASDDIKETFSETMARQLCDEYQLMDEQFCEQFPRLPTLSQMKQSLQNKNTEEILIPQLLELTDFSNMVIKSLIQKSNIAQDDVRDFWRRLSVSFALYYEACKTEATTCAVPYEEIGWRRCFSGAVLPWLFILEVTSGALGKARAHISLIMELFSLSSIFCTTVNDVYSQERDIKHGTRIGNTIITFEDKESSGQIGGVQKAIRILNEIIKVVYQKIEKCKEENHENAELCKLMDNIGEATIGWYFFHHYSSRYADEPCRLTLVDVEEEELKEWRRSTDKPMEEVKYFLQNSCPKAKQIYDYVLSGVINMHENLLPA